MAPTKLLKTLVYFAELQEPLDFGTEPLTLEPASSINTAPQSGSFVHARLMTALSSATTQTGEGVEAVLSQPLFDRNRVLFFCHFSSPDS
ncbi:MAG: hypothetical protein WBC04_02980 [Candidatus Acidiferrales bacterium]